MAEPLIQHVSDTAFLVARYRAIESARPDALFRDAFADRLAGEKGKAIVASRPTPAMAGWQVAIRTVVIDELIREAVARGVGMVINLGAGLDARPYRLDLPPDMVWIEVDYPDVIRFKRERLSGEAPRFGMEQVELDLAGVGARRWRSREVRYLADEGVRRGRQLPLPRLILWMVKLLGPLTAARRDGFRRSLAYVLLEPKSPSA